MKRAVLVLTLLVGCLFSNQIRAEEAKAVITEEVMEKSSPSTTINNDPHVRVVRLDQVIHFQQGSSTLDDAAKTQLDQVFLTLIEYPRLNIVAWGTADEVGPDLDNLDLSQRRAKTVVAYLLNKTYNNGKKLSKIRVKAAGSGEYDMGRGPEYMTVRFYIDGGYFIIENGSPPPMCDSSEAEGKNFCQEERTLDLDILDLDISVNTYQMSRPPTCTRSHTDLTTEPPRMEVKDRSWTLGQRILASTIVGLVTASGSAGVTYLADVHNEDIRTSGGGHYESYRDVDIPEFIAAGAGFAGGFAGTFWFTGHVWRAADGSFNITFGNNGGSR